MLIKYVVGIMKDMMDMAILMGLVGDQILFQHKLFQLRMFMMLLRVNVAIKKHIVMNKL